jgi:probable HAF family extracellular repeat protein
MRHATIRFSVLTAVLVAVLPLRAAAPAVGPDDIGSLGGSPFAVHPGKVGRNGTVPINTMKPVSVPAAWTAAGGVAVISNSRGVAAAANGVGQVVGTLEHEDAPWEAYLWTPPNTLTIITSNQAYSITPQVVNDSGQVAGVADMNSGGRHAFLWSAAGGFRDLGSLGGFDLQVTDITENGLVVGHAGLENGETRAFLSRNGGMIRDLGTLGGNLSQATAANDAGMIVGYSRTADFNLHGFVYHKGKMTALASATLESAANAINAGGTIVGHGIQFGVHTAMVWSPAGVPQEIAGADIAVDINDSGVVALYSGISPFTERRAFLWSAATGLLDAGTEDDVTSEAVGVTADGRLVARREDWTGTMKVFVWSPSTGRMFIDGLGGGFSRALFVNSSGKVAGFSKTIQGYFRAFLWTPGGTMIEVPAAAGWHSMPMGLNAAGAVAGVTNKSPGGFHAAGPSFFWPGAGSGFSDLGPVNVVDVNDAGQVLAYEFPTSAFIWKDGVVTTMPAIGEGSPVPSDINNLGQVVGRFNVDAWTIHAFSWKPGSAPVDLGTLGGTYSEAVAVNDAGQIAGTSNLTGDVASHAFRMTAGKKMTDLGTLVAGGESTATAINKNGVVIGNSSHDGSVFHAFLYDTKIRDLGDLGDPSGQPRAINDLKDVAGTRLTGPFFRQTAFVCLAGGPTVDLPGLDGEISRAFAINGSGVVVGDASTLDGQYRAVRWLAR